MTNTVIQFQNVSKHYVKQRLRYGLLSETLSQFINHQPSTIMLSKLSTTLVFPSLKAKPLALSAPTAPAKAQS